MRGAKYRLSVLIIIYNNIDSKHRRIVCILIINLKTIRPSIRPNTSNIITVSTDRKIRRSITFKIFDRKCSHTGEIRIAKQNSLLNSH